MPIITDRMVLSFCYMLMDVRGEIWQKQLCFASPISFDAANNCERVVLCLSIP
jgi:hypothetical protein